MSMVFDVHAALQFVKCMQDDNLSPTITFRQSHRLIVLCGGITFPEGTEAEINNILKCEQSTRKEEYTILKILNGQDFYWPAFDNCIKICEEKGLFPSCYDFLRYKPMPVFNTADLTKYLTVAEMQKVLKDKNIKAQSRRREDVVISFSRHITLNSIHALAQDAITRYTEKYKKKKQKAKISMLCRDICSLAYSMRAYGKYLFSRYFECIPNKGIMCYISTNDDDKALASMIYIGGYEAILDCPDMMLPPLFPGDPFFFHVETARDAKGKFIRQKKSSFYTLDKQNHIPSFKQNKYKMPPKKTDKNIFDKVMSNIISVLNNAQKQIWLILPRIRNPIAFTNQVLIWVIIALILIFILLFLTSFF